MTGQEGRHDFHSGRLGRHSRGGLEGDKESGLRCVLDMKVVILSGQLDAEDSV